MQDNFATPHSPSVSEEQENTILYIICDEEEI